MGKILIFRHYYDPIEASIVKERLESEGIPCFLSNENASYVLNHMNVGHGGVSIMMDEDDFPKAMEILGLENES